MSKADQLNIMQALTIDAIEKIIAQGLMTRDQALEAMSKMSLENVNALIKSTADFLNKELA
jgi:hypothetical protein